MSAAFTRLSPNVGGSPVNRADGTGGEAKHSPPLCVTRRKRRAYHRFAERAVNGPKGVISVILLLILAGCEQKSAPPPPRPIKPAEPPIKIVFFFDDGTSAPETIAFSDAKAANVVIRPMLARVFKSPEHGPRVVRWLLDDVRSHGPPAPFRGGGVEGELRATVSTYREYRIGATNTYVPTIPAIESRHGPNDAWRVCAGVPDPETGLNRAAEYLAEDLKTICESAGVPLFPAR
jgi:hypothetical protein